MRRSARRRGRGSMSSPGGTMASPIMRYPTWRPISWRSSRGWWRRLGDSRAPLHVDHHQWNHGQRTAAVAVRLPIHVVIPAKAGTKLRSALTLILRALERLHVQRRMGSSGAEPIRLKGRRWKPGFAGRAMGSRFRGDDDKGYKRHRQVEALVSPQAFTSFDLGFWRGPRGHILHRSCRPEHRSRRIRQSPFRRP